MSRLAVEFDLVCVYRGNVNPELVARWQADHPGQIEPWVLDGFMINNNARTRTVGLADSFWVHGTQWTDTGCPFAQPDVPFNTANDVWISIAGGQAQWMVSSCGGPVEGTAPTTTLPPPPAAPTGALAFPYATVYEVPQLGHEPVRGTGCGGDGSIGDVIPDGLWWGAIAGQSTTTLEFDLACIYTGPVGEQMGEQFIAANPDYGSPPYWPGVGFFVNNNPRTRTVAAGTRFRPRQRILERRRRRHWHVHPAGRSRCGRPGLRVAYRVAEHRRWSGDLVPRRVPPRLTRLGGHPRSVAYRLASCASSSSTSSTRPERRPRSAPSEGRPDVSCRRRSTCR